MAYIESKKFAECTKHTEITACKFNLVKGKRKNNPCGLKVAVNSEFCIRHLNNTKPPGNVYPKPPLIEPCVQDTNYKIRIKHAECSPSPSENVTAEQSENTCDKDSESVYTQQDSESDESSSSGSGPKPVKVKLVRHKLLDKFVHLETNFVFEDKKSRLVIGKLVGIRNQRIENISQRDTELCLKYNFDYELEEPSIFMDMPVDIPTPVGMCKESDIVKCLSKIFVNVN
jgi:hypothetical protein